MEKGVRPGTRKKDDRAWLLWEHVCRAHGTSPLRSADEVTRHPERNAYLLACLLMHAVAVCRPKSKQASFIKPASALAYPLAVIRIFRRWHVTMPSYKLLRAQLSGLKDEYLHVHGPNSLAPKRAPSL